MKFPPLLEPPPRARLNRVTPGVAALLVFSHCLLVGGLCISLAWNLHQAKAKSAGEYDAYLSGYVSGVKAHATIEEFFHAHEEKEGL